MKTPLDELISRITEASSKKVKKQQRMEKEIEDEQREVDE